MNYITCYITKLVNTLNAQCTIEILFNFESDDRNFFLREKIAQAKKKKKE